MILIYTNITSARLQYICEFIFKEQLGIDFRITTVDDLFNNFEGFKINYSAKDFNDSFKIQNTQLLFETDIRQQNIECYQEDTYTAFYKINNSDISFDIFAACFYLLSRYEEYLPHQKDMYSRYAHQNSLAFKEGFLNEPIINKWLEDFKNILKNTFPTINYKLLNFKFLPTYDIDIGWSYKNKGLIRNLGGFIRSPAFERIKVLTGSEKDPYDSYGFLNNIHQHYKLDPLYFFLVAAAGSRYDKNISSGSKAMQVLINEHALKYKVGLHPSWKSNENISILKEEKKYLETYAEKNIPVIHSRQHYIKFDLPQTFECLIEAGIQNDYSMGYGSINGFRASVASAFYWYNLKTEKKTGLCIHPFCFMDANSYYEQHLNSAEAFNELVHYYNQCKNVNGQMITIFHNNFLGTEKRFTGWKEMYEKFVAVVETKN